MICLLILLSCSRLPPELKTSSEYLVSGCTIYNLDGKVVLSYPGLYCLFLEDGSYLSYDEKKLELSKFDSSLKKEWSLHQHVHHELKLTMSGEYLVNSSVVKNNVRYDEVLLVGKSGKIKKSFSFHTNFKEIRPPMSPEPYQARWEENLNFTHEFTHVAASYEITEDMKLGDEVFAPKGSFLISLNSFGSGIYVLDEKMEKILNYRKLPVSLIFHDAQRFSDTEVLYFYNTGAIDPNKNQEAQIVIYDVFQEKITHSYKNGFFGLFGGGVQDLGNGLFLVSDSYSQPQSRSVSKREFHRLMKGRVVFYSTTDKKHSEVRFNQALQQTKLVNLKSFLRKNIGL